MFEKDFECVPLMGFELGRHLCLISSGGRLGSEVEATLLEAGFELGWKASSMEKEGDFHCALRGKRHAVSWIDLRG